MQTHTHEDNANISSNLHCDASIALIDPLFPRGHVGHVPEGTPLIVLAAPVHSSDAYDTKGACHCLYNIVG